VRGDAFEVCGELPDRVAPGIAPRANVRRGIEAPTLQGEVLACARFEFGQVPLQSFSPIQGRIIPPGEGQEDDLLFARLSAQAHLG
jgi:hypothetical protein